MWHMERGSTMGMKDMLKNAAHIARGKGKEQAGKVTSDPRLESEGKSERTKGDLNQAAESVKDALK